jgi:hypothetical protein
MAAAQSTTTPNRCSFTSNPMINKFSAKSKSLFGKIKFLISIRVYAGTNDYLLLCAGSMTPHKHAHNLNWTDSLFPKPLLITVRSRLSTKRSYSQHFLRPYGALIGAPLNRTACSKGPQNIAYAQSVLGTVHEDTTGSDKQRGGGTYVVIACMCTGT